MTITIEPQGDLTEWLAADAAQHGLSPEEYALQTLQQVHQVRAAEARHSAATRERRRQAALARFRKEAFADLAVLSDNAVDPEPEEVDHEERRWRKMIALARTQNRKYGCDNI